MNFIEAVQILKDGGCEGIKTKSGLVFILLHDGFLEAVESPGTSRGPSDTEAILGDWQLVNPKPQTETVEVRALVTINTHNGLAVELSSIPREPSVDRETIELVGTFEREIKPKMKRRERIGAFTGYAGHAMRHDIPKNAPLFAEWEE